MRRLFPLILGIITLAEVALLLVWDAAPGHFPAGSHDLLAALSLASIAVSLMVFQLLHRASAGAMFKAVLLAAAFLFWAANQFWPNSPRATLFNDLAIGLFVLDVFFVIAEGPADKSNGRMSDSGSTAGL
jgi:hypothetical protein